MQEVDVCVIGGGIQGCGVAQAAAASGFRTLLLEQTALASATSSRSSKLIHGGLRYLESGQFVLVTKSLAERERLLRNAPELVKRMSFYIPIYKQTRRRPWQIALGLALYALLGRLRANCRYRRLPAQEWSGLNGLKQEGLQAVYQYWDAQTDDQALTRAVMQSAVELGTQLLCPARFLGARYKRDHYQVEYEQNNHTQQLSSRVLINAAGPWVVQVHNNLHSQIHLPQIDLVQGTHLILKQPAPSGVYYVEAPLDQRAVFIMPWQGHTLIGTTETVVSTNPSAVRPLTQEVDYLLHVAQTYFPHIDTHVMDQFAGVRVLPKSAKGVFRRPRDTLLFSNPELPCYFALIGGKLTTYRATAEQVISKVRQQLPPRHAIIDTRELKLTEVRKGHG